MTMNYYEKVTALDGYVTFKTSAQFEHITIQTGGSWGSAPGYYVGGEHTKPEPFYGWEGVQS